jgi:hypothetical protein
LQPGAFFNLSPEVASWHFARNLVERQIRQPASPVLAESRTPAALVTTPHLAKIQHLDRGCHHW